MKIYLAFYILLVSNVDNAISSENYAFGELLQGHYKFTTKLYRELVQHDSNIIFSPIAAHTVLALLREGATNKTEQELAKGLFLPECKRRTEEAFEVLFSCGRNSCSRLDRLMNNKYYISKELKLKPNFKTAAEAIYNVECEKIDFAENRKAAREINSWISGHSSYHIREIIESTKISADITMLILNSLSFKEQWKEQFSYFKTSYQYFETYDDEDKLVLMMEGSRKVKFWRNEDLKAKFLVLDFKNSNFYAEFVLPFEPDGFSYVEQNLLRVLMHDKFFTEKVDIKLPRFNLYSEIEFVPILQNMGVHRAFEEDLAEFDGMWKRHASDEEQELEEDKRKLHVDSIIQKVCMNVTEDGISVAPSALSVFSYFREFGPSGKFSFTANRPFFFAIREKSGLVLLVGKYSKPNTFGCNNF